MRVTRRSVFKEEGHVITGTTTLTVHLKDANAARRMVTQLSVGWSRVTKSKFLKLNPIPQAGVWANPCELVWVVGEPCFKIPIQQRADVFVSPRIKQVKIQALGGPTAHGGYWDDAIRAARCSELYQITEDAQLKLRINLMKRAKRIMESTS